MQRPIFIPSKHHHLFQLLSVQPICTLEYETTLFFHYIFKVKYQIFLSQQSPKVLQIFVPYNMQTLRLLATITWYEGWRILKAGIMMLGPTQQHTPKDLFRVLFPIKESFSAGMIVAGLFVFSLESQQIKGKIKIQAISAGHIKLLRDYLKWYQFITLMEACASRKLATALILVESLPESDRQTSKIQTQNQELTELKCIEKYKKIIKKPESILRKLRIQNPIDFTHVHSIFNLLGINESALKDSTFEESFFKTMFYINTVEKVELRKQALIIQLKPSEKSSQPIPYLIERYKSFGDKKFYDIAASLETVASKVTGQGFMQKLKNSFDGEPLSRFIDSMEGQAYMCKVAPNKLVISRGLLELLGEDPENYAVEMCKYKMPLREIISAKSYVEIIKKSIDNVGSICDFINAAISAEDLHAKTSIDFTDYIINRQNKKIYCNLILFMPTPQMSCIQVRQVLKQSDDVTMRCQNFARKREIVERHCEEIRYSEAEVLKNIMRVPDGLLKSNKKKLADYRDISTMA